MTSKSEARLESWSCCQTAMYLTDENSIHAIFTRMLAYSWRSPQVAQHLYVRFNVNTVFSESYDRMVALTVRHQSDVIMRAMASQITGVSIAYSSVCLGTYQVIHQITSLASAFHRELVDFIHKGKGFPCRDIIMAIEYPMYHQYMLTSSNGNIFSVTGHLCAEFAGHRWIPAENSGEFQRGIHRSPVNSPHKGQCDIFFDLHLNKRLSKHWWGWWFETQSHPLWRLCNELSTYTLHTVFMSLSTSWHRPLRPRAAICDIRQKIGLVAPMWLILYTPNLKWHVFMHICRYIVRSFDDIRFLQMKMADISAWNVGVQCT